VRVAQRDVHSCGAAAAPVRPAGAIWKMSKSAACRAGRSAPA